MNAEQKLEALRSLSIEINADLVDDEEVVARLDEIGATEEELDKVLNEL
jgi:hypothetical protein